MLSTKQLKRITSPILGLALGLVMVNSQAAGVGELVDSGNTWLAAQKQSQERVNSLSGETRDLDAEYERIVRQIEGLEAYNSQLGKQIAAQESEIAKTDDSIYKATEVDRQLLPLLNNMVGTYEKLVEVSIPFAPKERAERISFLNETIDRADVAAAEKFRQVLDAYMIEMQYGSTIEAYSDLLTVDGAEREVNVLRLGRVALYYQTADREHTGMWDAAAGQWVPLDGSFRNGVYQAIRVANKLTAPSLLSLPLPQPQGKVKDAALKRDEAVAKSLAMLRAE